VSDPDDLLQPGLDYAAFRAARERFFALVRPEAMQDPPALCPNTLPREWTTERGEPQNGGGE